MERMKNPPVTSSVAVDFFEELDDRSWERGVVRGAEVVARHGHRPAGRQAIGKLGRGLH
jgi:hypothetical protein